MSEYAAGTLRGRILVADDVADAANSLVMLCEMFGAQARSALSGREAVKIAEEFRPDVILMDISMPGMNGYEAARTIRRAEWGKTMKLIALTGWGRASDLEAARAAGFDDHLLKPVEPEALLRVLTQMCGRAGT